MTTTMTLARLRDLRLSGMAQALVRQQEQVGTYEALPFLERLGLLVEQECLEREHRKQERLIRQARFNPTFATRPQKFFFTGNIT